ncbi:MAG: GAF domain-containing protein [Acidobacteriaceae bacterium]|nr:GAF domain-containing protein [Acidobacteriaceae bacterium]
MNSVTPFSNQASKTDLYRQICEQLQQLIGGERDFIANAANTAALLFHSLQDVSWVGCYLRQGEDLVVGPFQGKPACSRIPVGRGVCGSAAESEETVIVPNVSEFPGHIACDPASASEIVVPLLNWGKLIGVLDIDSASLNRFDEDDQEGLESVAAILLASQPTDDLPDLSQTAID